MFELLKGIVFVGGWMLMTAFWMACVGGVIGLARILLRREKLSPWRDVVR
jgi:hypothetical protein